MSRDDERALAASIEAKKLLVPTEILEMAKNPLWEINCNGYVPNLLDIRIMLALLAAEVLKYRVEATQKEHAMPEGTQLH